MAMRRRIGGARPRAARGVKVCGCAPLNVKDLLEQAEHVDIGSPFV